MSVVKYKDKNGEWRPMANANPVGIDKIEQTAVATEEGSENKIKFTLTNGREYEVAIQYLLTAADKAEIAELAAALVDEGLLATIGSQEVTA